MTDSRSPRALASIVALVSVALGCSGQADPFAEATQDEPRPVTTSESVASTGSDDEANGGTSEPSSGADSTTDAPVATSQLADPPPSRCDPSGIDDPASAPVTVRVWHALGGDAEGFVQLLADRFEAEHEKIRVDIVKLDTGYPGAIDLLANTPVDELPDVIMGSNQVVRLLHDSGRFIDPADCTGGDLPEQFDDLLPVVAATYTVDGDLRAAPFNVSAPVMLYDAKRWRSAGLDPADPPSDLDELETAIRQLVDSGAAATGAVLYDRSAMWFVEQRAAQAGRLLAEPDNGRSGLELDRVQFGTPDAIDTLTRLQGLARDGYILWNGVSANNEDLAQLVHPTEPSGLTFNTSAVLGDIIRLAQEGIIPDVEIAVAPFPGPPVGSTAGGGAWWLLDNGDPARAGAAWLVVDWLTRPGIVAEFAAYTGYVPTTVRAAEAAVIQEQWRQWPIMRVAYDQLAASPATPAAAGLQVGPLVEVLRNLELAAAYTIDAGFDAAAELASAEDRSAAVIQVYRDTVQLDAG
ncbi:MAG: extracellular solute-binding protein [Ilumatobacteraceae bacterium]